MPMECRHIQPSGRKCRALALRGALYCYFHTRLHRRIAQWPGPGEAGKSADADRPQPLEIPFLEDRTAIQLLIPDVLNALLAKKIDAKCAAILLSGMRLAAQNANQSTCAPWDKTVELFTRTANGHELALEEEEYDERYECDDGKLILTDGHEVRELTESSQSSDRQLPNPAAIAQSAEALSGAGELPIVAPLVKVR